MRDVVESITATIGVAGCLVLAVVATVGLSWGGYLAYLKFVEGPAITQHTLNIRHSLGYVDAQNSHARDLITEYAGVSASDSSHRCALLLDIRANAAQLSPAEVSADVAQFLSVHQTDCGGQ